MTKLTIPKHLGIGGVLLRWSRRGLGASSCGEESGRASPMIFLGARCSRCAARKARRLRVGVGACSKYSTSPSHLEATFRKKQWLILAVLVWVQRTANHTIASADATNVSCFVHQAALASQESRLEQLADSAERRRLGCVCASRIRGWVRLRSLPGLRFASCGSGGVVLWCLGESYIARRMHEARKAKNTCKCVNGWLVPRELGSSGALSKSRRGKSVRDGTPGAW